MIKFSQFGLNEESVNQYKTKVKGKSGPWRAEVVHKETGKRLYLGSVAFTHKVHAQSHGEEIRKAHARGADHAAAADRAYAHRNREFVHVKESVDEAATVKATSLAKKDKAKAATANGQLQADLLKVSTAEESVEIKEGMTLAAAEHAASVARKQARSTKLQDRLHAKKAKEQLQKYGWHKHAGTIQFDKD